MADYRLTQTGAEVQNILNQVPDLAAEVLLKYTKPDGGIPDSDLTSALQSAIEKALTAYQKPGTGIPKTDLATAVQNLLDAAGTAYQKPGTGIPKTDLATAVQNLLDAAGTAYQKPGTGIPLADLNASVQAAINASAGMAADIAAERLARETADLALNEALGTKLNQSQVQALITAAVAGFVTSSQVQSAITTALAPYSTTDATAIAIQNAITAALTNYYNATAINQMLSEKVNKVTGKQLSTEDFTTALKAKLDALPTSQGLVELIATAISSALSDYSTTSQMEAAIQADITAALASYYNKTEVDEKFSATNGRVQFLEQGLGKYNNTRSITLQQATAGKYVNVNGQEVSASGYGISEEVNLNAGDILLVPSASAVPADVSLFARIVTRTYDKVITYAYTYRQDYPELPATATADYNPALIYTAQYDESGDTPVLTGWVMGGQTYATLPATRDVTESYYEPLMKQAVAAMPSTGYYVYLCPTAMTVVVSGYTATVSGGVALVVGLGIFKNIATNFIGAPGQAVIAQAFAQLLGEIEGLKAQLDNLGETRAVCINSEDIPKVQNYPMIVYGAGAPSAPNVPAFIGQKYLDTTNKKEYTAFSVTNSVSDWVLIN